MYQGLCEVSDLLVKFGGHPMAAGLSIEESDIDEFRRRLNENAKLTEDDFVPQIWIDVPMPFEYVNEKIVDELKGLEPFGQGNEKPLFAQKSLTIRNVRVLGKKSKCRENESGDEHWTSVRWSAVCRWRSFFGRADRAEYDRHDLLSGCK